MTRILDRYVGATVLASMLVVLFVVVGLDFIFTFVAELNELEGNYQLKEAMLYMVLRLPRRLYEFIPLAALVGCLAGLGVLANRSELIVMRAAGTSINRIAWSVLQPTILMILLALILGELIAPYTEKLAETGREIAQGGDGMKKSKHGHWYREGNSFIHFNAAETNGVLHGLTIYEFDDEGLMTEMLSARRALYQGEHWVMQDIVGTSLSRYQNTRFEHKTKDWESQLTPSLLDVLFVEPDKLSIIGLLQYARYRADQGLESGSYWLAFWKKLLMPLSMLALVLIGLSFIFGPLRDGTMGFRIFSGVIVGLLFKYAQDLLGPSSLVFGFPPIMATLVPIVICGGVGWYLLRKAG